MPACGPPVLLHHSPLSSVEIESLLLRLSERNSVLAADTPGYGASEPRR